MATTLPRKTQFSALQEGQRRKGHTLPACFRGSVKVSPGVTRPVSDAIRALLPTTHRQADVTLLSCDPDNNSPTHPPLRVGVVLSGGQAPGGHNVIAGVYDYAKALNPSSRVFGFLNGPHGIFSNVYTEIDKGLVADFRNMGGFDMIGSGRHKIHTAEQFAASLKTCTDLRLDGVVVIGGDDSNTNAAMLAEYFAAQNSTVKVLGVPKTIDGDLKILGRIPVSFGFHTATRTFSEMVGNIMLDCLSSQKYYHFVRLMGRSASHIALEVALQTRPNMVFIGEEVASRQLSLKAITDQIVTTIVDRAAAGKHYGVIVVPEGLVEFVPEMKRLIAEINEVLARGVRDSFSTFHQHLSPDNAAVFESLPKPMKLQLLLDRDAHGNVAVSKIETEKLLAGMVELELARRAKQGTYDGHFMTQFHFFGYDGRSGLPSNFDNNYCYAMGATASALLQNNRTGLMVAVNNLLAPVEEWECGGVSIAAMMRMERRAGKDKGVIAKALVCLDGEPFRAMAAQRACRAINDYYCTPGPLQLVSRGATVELPITTRLEVGGADELKAFLEEEPPLADPGYDGHAERKTAKRRRLVNDASDKGAGEGGDADDVDMGEDGAVKRAGGSTRPKGSDLGSRYHYPAKHVPLLSTLQRMRLRYKPKLPPALLNPGENVCAVSIGGSETQGAVNSVQFLRALFPKTYGQPLLELQRSRLSTPTSEGIGAGAGAGAGSGGMGVGSSPSFPAITVGVVLCGRQAAGGANIIWGLHDLLKARNPSSTLLGFEGGTQGMFARRAVTITEERLAFHKNQGGYDILGRSVDQIKTPKQVQACQASCQAFGLDGLVLIGGTHTASNAAALAETFENNGVKTRVIAAPAGIDNCFKNDHVETTVGFHTACSVFSQLIGNIATDANSAKKYWHFVRLMGRTPSHIALECALQTQPNIVLIGEEIKAKRLTLRDVTNQIADVVEARARVGKNFGVCLVPEGTISHIPELRTLIDEMNHLFAQGVVADDVAGRLTPWSAALLSFLPRFIQRQLILDREANGFVQLSQIESEKLLAGLVGDELGRRKVNGSYSGKFASVCSFNGYEARSSLPTNFDCDYAYTLGHVAGTLVHCGVTGYLASVRCLKRPTSQWAVGAAPLSAMAVVERQIDGTLDAVIQPTIVDLADKPFRTLASIRPQLMTEELYINPGPIQFFGETADCRAKTLCLEESDYLDRLKLLHQQLETVREVCKPGCSRASLDTALAGLSAVTRILATLRKSSQGALGL